MTTWQPIESAPKDGTPIILLVNGVAIEGRWDDQSYPDKNIFYGDGEWDVISLPSHGCGCCSGDDPLPTHWMPLPAPPTGDA